MSSDVFVVADEIKITKIRYQGSTILCGPKVKWLSRHDLSAEQKLVIARLDGEVDIEHHKNFWADTVDDFLKKLEVFIQESKVVYVVAPREWLVAAANTGLVFRTFNCDMVTGNVKLKCVYQYDIYGPHNIFGAHQLR
ncbi:MAG: hypothetical protein A2571_00495 [Candidatus Vogelbacteria bacterium RIFOXYD1_FULL_44_32]|uniref:Uncharacterized protein n=1 Tax=Candidatus Vogelbacteria bacterium RIFOXYD1_FULL_44_32 TaxID=1802438 RepID=A0A1G2QE33_9BACT|nr:MAG: hypothetical protein A2571_00495 [Candidatus Vogelbacteria bacterium RIFOXYD1_FULL_44_32]